MYRKCLLLVAFPLAISSGCYISQVQTSRGPVKTDVAGVTVEMAPEVAGEVMESGEGEGFGEARSGGTTVRIQNMQLTVNGKSYGTVQKGDHVLVEKDSVKVNGAPRAEDKQPAPPA
jgi:hypothetical protein